MPKAKVKHWIANQRESQERRSQVENAVWKKTGVVTGPLVSLTWDVPEYWIELKIK